MTRRPATRLLRGFGRVLVVDETVMGSCCCTAPDCVPPRFGHERYGQHEQRAFFAGQLLERLAALPGVTAAGATPMVPIEGNGTVSFVIADRSSAPDQ